MRQQTSSPIEQSSRQSFLARILDPIDRLTESIYSVLIVLTFTLAYSAIGANTPLEHQIAMYSVTRMFGAAFGCAVAWGIIDGIMYVLTAMFERGQQRRLAIAVRAAGNEQAGIAVLGQELDGELAGITTPEARANLYQSMYAKLLDGAADKVGFHKEDFAGALGVALTAVLAALPVALPLLLAGTLGPNLAVRVSNWVAFAMLFFMGFRWGQFTGAVGWKTGLLLLLVGVSMMLVAIPLGG